jgi:hypothetical protein
VIATRKFSPSLLHNNLVAVKDDSGSATEFVDVKDWLKTLRINKDLKEGDLDPI